MVVALLALCTSLPSLASAGGGSLFGLSADSDSNTAAFTKWHGALDRQADVAPTKEIEEWKAYLATLRGKSPEAQVNAVNSYMNKVRYVSDRKNYGKGDYWATVAEFMSRGGDCEDYSLAKYFSLLALGFDAKDMRVVILFDRAKRIEHAVLAVSLNGRELILDNQSARVREDASISNYKPIYAVARDMWWRFSEAKLAAN